VCACEWRELRVFVLEVWCGVRKRCLVWGSVPWILKCCYTHFAFVLFDSVTYRDGWREGGKMREIIKEEVNETIKATRRRQRKSNDTQLITHTVDFLKHDDKESEYDFFCHVISCENVLFKSEV
jgi:hypothetical protein